MSKKYEDGQLLHFWACCFLRISANWDRGLKNGPCSLFPEKQGPISKEVSEMRYYELSKEMSPLYFGLAVFCLLSKSPRIWHPCPPPPPVQCILYTEDCQFRDCTAWILKHLLEAEKSTFQEELFFQSSERTTWLKQFLCVDRNEYFVYSK
jgi:hypothetical protein